MLPNLIIIGAPKSGTTSLHYYLGLHPDIAMSAEKEPTFFADEEVKGRGPSFLPGTWSRGVEWYASLFDGRARVRGEASTMYANHPLFPGVPARMHAVVPEAKLIYLVRDPVERALADYTHLLVSGVERRPLAEAFDPVDANPYVWRSSYALQLEQYLRLFAREQILVIPTEDLQDRREETLGRVFRFLGVSDHSDRRFAEMKERHADKRPLTPAGARLASARKPGFVRRLPPGLRRRVTRPVYRMLSRPPARPELPRDLQDVVAEQLRGDVTRLRTLTGLELERWSV